MTSRRGQVGAALFGRASERETLTALLDEAESGHAQYVIVTGDAGVGKTALVHDVCDSRLDTTVLTGTCLPLVSVAVPFLALRDLVRSARAMPDVVVDDPLEVGSELTGVDEWVSGMSRERPLVLLLDDLHWADPGTLDVLTYLIAGPASRPLAILITLRRQELLDDRPVMTWLTDVRRLPGVTEIALNPIDRTATGEQVGEVLGGLAHQSLIDDVYGRSRGNPYLTRLLVEGLPVGARRLDDDLPRDLRSAVTAAWAAMSPDARTAGITLAVNGGPMPLADLAMMIGTTEASVRADMSDAVATGLVEVSREGLVWFRHPLSAETLEENMSPAARADAHAQFARRLEAGDLTGPAWPAGAIADHWLRSQHTTEAYSWAVRAADDAERAADWKNATRMLERAVTLHRSGSATGALLPLLRRLRAAAAKAGLLETELDTIEALLGSSSADEAPAEVAELLVRRIQLGYSTGRSFFRMADAEEAMSVAERAPSTPQHVLAIAELAHTALWHADERAPMIARRALSEARAVGDDRALSHALTSASMATLVEGDGPGALALGREGVEAARRCGDWLAFVYAAMWESNALDTWAARVYVDNLRRRREALLGAGAPHEYTSVLGADEASGLMAIGDGPECAERLREVFASNPGPLADVHARVVAARLATWQGRQRDAEQHLARADELLAANTFFTALFIDAVRAEVLLGAGDPAGAYAAAQVGMRFDGLPPTMCEWLVPLAARALGDLAQRDRDAGREPTATLRALDELVTECPQLIRDIGVSSPVWDLQVDALSAVYAAEIARGRATGEQSARWIEAVDALVPSQLAWEEAYARWRAADALISLDGDRIVGAAMLRDGLALADRLGAQPVGNELRALARRARISIAQPIDMTVDALTGSFAVTAREREILSLVVAGRTYGQIARELFISEKTVSTHISHLLAKTGAANRFELAGLAERAGVGVAD